MMNRLGMVHSKDTHVCTCTHTAFLMVSLLLSYKSRNTPVAWESEHTTEEQPSSLHWDREGAQRHEREREEEEIPYIASHFYARLLSEKWRYPQIFRPSLSFDVAFKGSCFLFGPIEMPPAVTGCKVSFFCQPHFPIALCRCLCVCVCMCMHVCVCACIHASIHAQKNCGITCVNEKGSVSEKVHFISDTIRWKKEMGSIHWYDEIQLTLLSKIMGRNIIYVNNIKHRPASKMKITPQHLKWKLVFSQCLASKHKPNYYRFCSLLSQKQNVLMPYNRKMFAQEQPLFL